MKSDKGRVPGEYEHVALASENVAVMREAHATPCTRDEARAMLVELAGLHSVSGLLIRFTSPWGRAGSTPVHRRSQHALPSGQRA